MTYADAPAKTGGTVGLDQGATMREISGPRLAQLEAIERAWKWIEEHRADVESDDDNWRVTWWNGEEWAIETGSTRLQAVQKAMAASEGTGK